MFPSLDLWNWTIEAKTYVFMYRTWRYVSTKNIRPRSSARHEKTSNGYLSIVKDGAKNSVEICPDGAKNSVGVCPDGAKNSVGVCQDGAKNSVGGLLGWVIVLGQIIEYGVVQMGHRIARGPRTYTHVGDDEGTEC